MNNVALITGASSGIGKELAYYHAEKGGDLVLVARSESILNDIRADLEKSHNVKVKVIRADLSEPDSASKIFEATESEGIQIDILINNAAKDPKVKKGGGLTPDSRFETMTPEYWNEGVDAAMNGTFYCSQAVANKMLQNGGGVILNIASDLGVIAPDQRLYRKNDVAEEMQNVKPITYSAAKWAIVGMTKYLAVYFAEKNIRVNSISPTAVYNNHPEEFVEKLTNIIPMNRMSHIDEYKGAIVFMCSDASSYMTGENVVIDGGKSVW